MQGNSGFKNSGPGIRNPKVKSSALPLTIQCNLQIFKSIAEWGKKPTKPILEDFGLSMEGDNIFKEQSLRCQLLSQGYGVFSGQ